MDIHADALVIIAQLTVLGDVWCSSQGSQHECSRYINSPTPPVSRRASSVVGTASQSVHSAYRKRSSATSCHSAPATHKVDQVPGIRIQHIEALPYHVAVVTTDCGSGDHSCDEDAVDSAVSAESSDNKHRYIIIHNELSSVSSLSPSRSHSSKASSIINMNHFSSLEFDTDPAAVTMTTAAAASRRRYATQQVILLFSIKR